MKGVGIIPMTTKTNKYEWLNRFNDDLLQHKTRFTNKIPALCFTSDEALDPEIEKNANLQLEKLPLVNGNNLRRKHQFSDYCYYKAHQYEINPPDPTVVKQSIEYRLRRWNCQLLFDNQLLELLNENDYRCLIVDGGHDYFNNYHKDIEQRNSGILASCLVLVKPDGSYFYALPLAMEDVFENLLLSNKIAPNIYLSPTTGVPIIETTVLNVNEVLNQVPLTKIVDDKHLVRNNTDNHSLHKYMGTLQDQFSAKLIDKKKHLYQYVNVIKTDDLCTHNRQFVNDYLNHYFHAAIGTDGNMHYQAKFDQPKQPLTKFWQDLIDQPKTQNLNHYLEGINTLKYFLIGDDVYSSYQHNSINKAPINQTATESLLKFDWLHFGSQQVEDVPVKTKHAMIKPLTKPSGLNQILGLLQDDNKYHYFIVNNKLILLERSSINKAIIAKSIDWK